MEDCNQKCRISELALRMNWSWSSEPIFFSSRLDYISYSPWQLDVDNRMEQDRLPSHPYPPSKLSHPPFPMLYPLFLAGCRRQEQPLKSHGRWQSVSHFESSMPEGALNWLELFWTVLCEWKFKNHYSVRVLLVKLTSIVVNNTNRI